MTSPARVLQAATEFLVAAIVCSNYLICDEQYFFHIRPQYIPKNGFPILYNGKDAGRDGVKEKYGIFLSSILFFASLIVRKLSVASFTHRKDSVSHHKEVDDSDYIEPLVDIYSPRQPHGKRFANICLLGTSSRIALILIFLKLLFAHLQAVGNQTLSHTLWSNSSLSIDGLPWPVPITLNWRNLCSCLIIRLY